MEVERDSCSCQEWVTKLLGSVKATILNHDGLCYQTRMVSVGLIHFNFNIFNSFSIVRNHSPLNFPVNVGFTLVQMYSDATPVITLTFHLYVLSGSHLQVPLWPH